MTIELILMSILCLWVFINNEKKILFALIFSLPFLGFIKYVFAFYGGGEIISYWKEVAILILFIRCLKKSKKTDLTVFLISIFPFLFLVCLYYFINIDNFELATASLRNIIFPLLLVFSVSSIKLEYYDLNLLTKLFCISVILMALSGFVEHFFLRLPLLILLGGVDKIADAGRIVYNSTSWQIMGLNRMFGIMAGGPNQFGVFNGIAIAFLFSLKLSPQVLSFTTKNYILINFTLLISTFALLFSLSRAGMAIAGISISSMIFMSNRRQMFKYSLLLTFLAILIFISLSYIAPEINNVIVESLLAKESSASDRGNNVLRAISFLSNNPFGFGLGSTDIRGVSSNTNIYFAESSYLNLAIEIGIIGLSLYFILLFMFLKKIKKISNIYSNTSISIIFAVIFISFFSINTHQMPSLYIWWIIMGLGLNKLLTRNNLNLETKTNSSL